MGKPQLCLPQPSLQRALKERSPLSLNPSIPLNELLPLICRITSPASPRPPPSNPTAAKLRSGLCSGSREMFSEGGFSLHTLTENSSFGNFNLSVFVKRLYHLCNPAPWPSSGYKLCRGICCSVCHHRGRGCHPFLRRILTAHVGEIFLVFESRSELDIRGYKFFELLSLHSQVHHSVS